jgi:hypothetical protein
MRWLDGWVIRDLPTLTVRAPGVWHVCGTVLAAMHVVTLLDSLAVMPFR